MELDREDCVKAATKKGIKMAESQARQIYRDMHRTFEILRSFKKMK